VREVQMDGVWFCFYSKFQERLEEPQITHSLEEFKKSNFSSHLKYQEQHQPKEYQDYIHVCWTDHLPKSGGFMGLQNPPSFWRTALMKPVGKVEVPVIYDIVK